jgi:three-Cys-motif partner protein
MPEIINYEGREQSLIKHLILKNYLQKLTYKVAVGRRMKSTIIVTYIDGFSGPWQTKTPDYCDTSFQIAIDELRQVREALQKMNINLSLRCLFVEKEMQSFQRLEKHVLGINDIQFKLIHGDFEMNIAEVIKFAQSDGNMFTFTFIDPTGWTGFGMNAIRPLIRLNHSEILINFMTKDIIRFIDDNRPEIKATFIDLFGDFEVQKLWLNLQGREREEAIISAYRQRLKEESGFQYVADAIVLNPEKDRTHFNLIYGTRHLDGLLVFRNVEKAVMYEQNTVRSITKQKRRIENSNQGELFQAEEIANNDYFEEIRTRCLVRSRQEVETALKVQKQLSYDKLLGFLEMPMTYENDLKVWLKEWQYRGQVQILGLNPREYVPKKGKGHIVLWKNELCV